MGWCLIFLQEPVAVTTAIQEEIFLEMGVGKLSYFKKYDLTGVNVMILLLLNFITRYIHFFCELRLVWYSLAY